jgi:hypothetical protein
MIREIIDSPWPPLVIVKCAFATSKRSIMWANVLPTASSCQAPARKTGTRIRSTKAKGASASTASTP